MKRSPTVTLLTGLVIVALLAALVVNRWTDETRVEHYTCTRCRSLKRVATGQFDKQVTTTYLAHPNPALARQICSDDQAHRWTRGGDFHYSNGFGWKTASGSRDSSRLWLISQAEQLAVYERCASEAALQQATQHFERFNELPFGSADEYDHFEKSRQLVDSEIIPATLQDCTSR